MFGFFFPLPTSHYVGGQGQMTVGTQTGEPSVSGVCTRGLFCVWFKREREAYARRGRGERSKSRAPSTWTSARGVSAGGG